MAAIAPSIWELDDVKKGILCQLFGGNSKVERYCCLCCSCSTRSVLVLLSHRRCADHYRPALAPQIRTENDLEMRMSCIWCAVHSFFFRFVIVRLGVDHRLSDT